MRMHIGLIVIALVGVTFTGETAHAIGARGGGMPRGGGGGRVGGGMGGMPRPSMPSRPGGGFGGGGNLGGGNLQPPKFNRPPVNNPPKVNLPNVGGNGFNKPSGAMKPSTLPAQLPKRPTVIEPGKNRPTTLPGNITKPSTKPGSLPNLSGGRPTTLPGKLPTRPERPTPGDLGDFLGMQRPNKPTTLPAKVPGNIVGNRPNKPGFVRPDPKPGLTDKGWWNGGNIGSGNIGNVAGNIGIVGNKVINNRPGWVNIGNDVNLNINNRWQGCFNRPGFGLRPNIGHDHWHNWGDNFRHHWGHYHHCHHWYGQNWWHHHHHPICGWHYCHQFYVYPWYYWWGQPTWPTVTTWFAWNNAPAGVWANPVYYTYGSNGNVQIVNNMVTIEGETVATSEEFAESAGALATVEPPKSQAEAEKVEWLPLGTFAVVTSEKDVNSGRSIQLAVSKTGIIAGTAYNVDNDKAQTIQGRVDKDTQRVAFRIGDNETFVAETGIYNLTQEEAPLLVHFGKDRTENWLLVRLDQPEETPSEKK